MSEIYAISDDVLSPDGLIVAHAREILQSGVKFYQYRCKKAVKNEAAAREILALCEAVGAKFIVNDDLEFAARIGAKCAHIGRGDGSVARAREILGDGAFIGVSCYGDLELALRAQDAGAAYAAFGSVFESPTKPGAPRVSLEILARAKEILEIPVCAIGGINARNIAELSALKIDLVAVVSAIYKPLLIPENIAALKNAMKF